MSHSNSFVHGSPHLNLLSPETGIIGGIISADIGDPKPGLRSYCTS